MKKIAKMTFLAAALIMTLGLLTACGGQRAGGGGGGGAQDTAGQQLVGTWAWDAMAAYVYSFEANGDGWRGVSGVEVETFVWRAEGNDLLIDLTSGPGFDAANIITYERWTYAISSDVLTITSQQVDGMEFSYIRSN